MLELNRTIECRVNILRQQKCVAIFSCVDKNLFLHTSAIVRHLNIPIRGIVVLDNIERGLQVTRLWSDHCKIRKQMKRCEVRTGLRVNHRMFCRKEH